MQKEEMFKFDLPKINVFSNLGLQLDMKREVCTLKGVGLDGEDEFLN